MRPSRMRRSCVRLSGLMRAVAGWYRDPSRPDLHLDLAAGSQVRDHVLGIDDLDVVIRLDVRRGDRAFAILESLSST